MSQGRHVEALGGFNWATTDTHTTRHDWRGIDPLGHWLVDQSTNQRRPRSKSGKKVDFSSLKFF